MFLILSQDHSTVIPVAENDYIDYQKYENRFVVFVHKFIGANPHNRLESFVHLEVGSFEHENAAKQMLVEAFAVVGSKTNNCGYYLAEGVI